ncbi:hypothetical protein SISSUDRAFT_1001372 [Sistotremastrum suecicum HHB10207 ss-3]|uniref:Protein kinase domain-containing protein n=1 Tax=Sistotremastrum suecicum HHB10207 ss-3 TaxID=1314776 RepID=A0A166FW48_9AGAM|nr:hypothetical protein SISSUDRAFT_1001372 [Sistotremastrum suecicum HHB10207 ss-3]
MTTPTNMYTHAQRKEEHLRYLGELRVTEQRWASYLPWLKSLGYDLRPRYQPGWKASWLTSGIGAFESEDALLPNVYGKVMDAKRLSDGRVVALKLLPTHRKELPILTYLSSAPLRADPRNHSVPLLDVHPLPDTDEEVLAVMPLLVYFDRPPFETIGEILLCIYTYLEGLVFLHEHNIAHLDICAANALQDPGTELFPKGFHPARPTYYVLKPGTLKIRGNPPHTSRTLSPVNYHFIDFGESIKFESLESRKLIYGTVGHDLDVPEFAGGAADRGYDPFRLDIRAFGDMIKVEMYEEYHGSEILKPLIEAMCRDIPEERPEAVESLEILKGIISSQTPETLAAFARQRKVYSASYRVKQYHRHRWELQLMGRPPIYPSIPGLEVQPPRPLSFFFRTLTRLRLLIS